MTDVKISEIGEEPRVTVPNSSQAAPKPPLLFFFLGGETWHEEVRDALTSLNEKLREVRSIDRDGGEQETRTRKDFIPFSLQIEVLLTT